MVQTTVTLIANPVSPLSLFGLLETRRKEIIKNVQKALWGNEPEGPNRWLSAKSSSARDVLK